MSFGEKIKDLGRQLVGQGGEVQFKNDVLNYEKARGVSHEQAIKDVFLNRFRSIQTELTANGVIDSRSKDFFLFQTALNEVFGVESISQFTKDANDPTIFRALPMPIASPKEVKRAGDYFAKKFDGQRPVFSVLNDFSEQTKMMDLLLSRFSGDPRLSGANPLENIIVANPELGADIGKILEIKKALDRHERMFDKDKKFEKTMKEFRATAECSLTEMAWKAPTSYVSNVISKQIQAKNLGDFFGIFFSETGKFAGREAWAGTKFVAKAGATVGSYLKNKMMK